MLVIECVKKGFLPYHSDSFNYHELESILRSW